MQANNPRNNYMNNGQFYGGWQPNYSSRGNPNAVRPEGPVLLAACRPARR